MSRFQEDSDRWLIPRWRDSSLVAKSQELQPLKLARHVVHNDMPDLLRLWDDFNYGKSVGTAADLFNSASLLGHHELAKEAAQFIVSDERTPTFLLSIAKGFLTGDAQEHSASENTSVIEQSKTAISRLRRQFNIEPRNPILLIDLARHHVILGHDKRTIERCMSIAVALAPNNRWVLRTAARLLLHFNELEKAHRLLARHELTKYDPWLIAAEMSIAQASQQPVKYWKAGRIMLQSKSIPARHLSELASAAATLEMYGGKNKQAKKLFRQSLIAPTENSIAQVQWAERKRLNVDNIINPLLDKTDDAYEAMFWRAYNEHDMQQAAKYCQLWLMDEPFSSNPAIMLSYVLSLLDDYKGIEVGARFGLIANPHNLSLQNNYYFARVSSGELLKTENQSELSKALDFFAMQIRSNVEDVSHAIANCGLVFYRLGDVEKGREFYEQARELIVKSKLSSNESDVLMYHAREAFLANAPWALETLKLAKDTSRRLKNVGSEFYLRKLDMLFENPDKASEILSPASAQLLKKQQLVVVKKPLYRVEETPSGPVLWVPHTIR